MRPSHIAIDFTLVIQSYKLLNKFINNSTFYKYIIQNLNLFVNNFFNLLNPKKPKKA